ncbi:MAG: hypothetical protein FWG36_03730 [Oscillospiraceae bacterium]|nr:hypothetical protein [Oscillospiraceae bacterium]
MKLWQNTSLAAISAIIAAVLVFAALFFMLSLESSNKGFELPPEPDELSEIGSQVQDIAPPGLAPELVEITRDNAATLIAAMPRPSEYISLGRTVLYGDGAEREWEHRLYVLGGYQKIERYENGRLRDEMIFAPSTVYLFLDGQAQGMARGEFSPDAASRMPTHEDILESENIISAEYLLDNDIPCAHISAMAGYLRIDYFVGLEHGLLIKAVAHQGGELAWKFELLELSIERPDDSVFILPSGAYVWELS